MPTQEDKSKKLREEVFRRYDTLAPELKQAMASAATAEAIYAIGKKFGLNIEKTGHLADIIGYTILGIFPVADFIRTLKNSLEIDGAKAEEISREVNAKIFLAIREQLKKTHGEKWDERALRQPATDNQKPITTPPTKPTTDSPAQIFQKENLGGQDRQPTTPAIPKSPWEIKPDGFRKVEEIKSVIPPVSQPATNNLQPTTKAAEAEMKKVPLPPEPPKTREAPQPAPAPKMPDVLKEIQPMGMTDELGLQIKELWKKPRVMEAKKSAPPMGLPIMKEAEKLMQTPELDKPTTDNRQPTTLPLKPTTNNLQPITPKPQTPPAPQTQTPAQQKPAQAPSVQTPKYNMDPYREPIE